MIQSQERTQLSLVRKLAEVMAEVERVPKSGRNDFHRYDYATEADIVAAVRKGMASRGLMLFPTVEKAELGTVERIKGGKDRLVTLTVRFTVRDGDSGEEFSIVVLGEGQDQGDKATYKAMTGATKYALLKLFLIPTGDDPEREEEEDPRKQRQPKKPQQRLPPEDPLTPAARDRLDQQFSAAKAQMHHFAKPPPPDDVPPPTEADMPPPVEDPSAKAHSEEETHVQLGPHKGKAIISLLDHDLDTSIQFVDKILKDPKYKAARSRAKAEANLAALQAERDYRAMQPKEGAAP